MHIYVTTGTGEGPTPLAAFDAALINAGVANYNLICLSSVCQDPIFCTRRYESIGSSSMFNSSSHWWRSNGVVPFGAEVTVPCLRDACSAANSTGVR